MQLFDRVKKCRNAALAIILSSAGAVFAFDNTATLPAGINGPQIRSGFISDLNQKYDSSGQLVYLGDTKSINFDMTTLQKVAPDITQLSNALKAFSNQDIGSNITLGTLHVDAVPVIQYYAPIFARGITTNWTLGVGLPIIHYQNSVKFTQVGSNIPYYQSQFSGLSTTLDSAFARLNQDLTVQAQSQIVAKGYAPVGNRDETFIGDMQLVSAYRFIETPSTSMSFKTTFTLPTGPGYDDRDLVALNYFHQTSIENSLVLNHVHTHGITTSALLGFKLPFAEKLLMRIPSTLDETLPGLDREQTVSRQQGRTLLSGLGVSWDLNDAWNFTSGATYSEKNSDSISNTTSGTTEGLTSNTGSQSVTTKIGANYSSVRAFYRKEIPVPFMISALLNDTIYGMNTPRITEVDLTVMMFF